MKHPLLLVVSVVLIISTLGCGGSNLFEGSVKKDDYQTPIDKTQDYLNNGNYDKAIEKAQDMLDDTDPANDEEARQIMGQAYLGKAGLTFTELLIQTDYRKRSTTSNINILNFVALDKRNYVFQAAETLSLTSPQDNSVMLAKGIACLCASVLKITTTFNPSGGDLGTGTGGEPSANTTINATWTPIQSSVTNWALKGNQSLASATSDKYLLTASSDLYTRILVLNAQIVAPTDVTYAQLMSILGVL